MVRWNNIGVRNVFVIDHDDSFWCFYVWFRQSFPLCFYLFIKFNNVKHGHRYSDWYKPRESWEQRVVNDDTLSETIDLLKLQVLIDYLSIPNIIKLYYIVCLYS